MGTLEDQQSEEQYDREGVLLEFLCEIKQELRAIREILEVRHIGS